ncbi:uncharacterized protein LOC135441071 [Drosophila montana]|uniref:uncharacterized protein LOC135441071 n=1 Tax=Drosophila montana TaxID=40370 RepID=UPI00313DACEF
MAEEQVSDWVSDADEAPDLSPPRPAGGLVRTVMNFRGFPAKQIPAEGHLVNLEKELAQQGRLPRNLEFPKSTKDSVLISASNAAIAQAHQTYLHALPSGISESIREEVRTGFMEMMKGIIDLLGPPGSRESLTLPQCRRDSSCRDRKQAPSQKSERDPARGISATGATEATQKRRARSGVLIQQPSIRCRYSGEELA